METATIATGNTWASTCTSVSFAPRTPEYIPALTQNNVVVFQTKTDDYGNIIDSKVIFEEWVELKQGTELYFAIGCILTRRNIPFEPEELVIEVLHTVNIA